MKTLIDRATIAVLTTLYRGPSHHNERGASMVEYCLMVALIFLVCVGAVGFFGQQPSVPLSKAGSTLG